jgi:hypothetical protein
MYGYYSTPTFTTSAPQYFVGSNAGLDTKDLAYWQSPKRYKTHTPIEIAAQQFKLADEAAERAKASFRQVNLPTPRYVVNHTAPHPTTFVHNFTHGQYGLVPAGQQLIQQLGHWPPLVVGKEQLEKYIAMLMQQHPDIAAAMLENAQAAVNKTASATRTAINVAA